MNVVSSSHFAIKACLRRSISSIIATRANYIQVNMMKMVFSCSSFKLIKSTDPLEDYSEVEAFHTPMQL